MEMTISEAIKHGEEQLEIFGSTHKEFIEIALNTMRKYQKIKDIVKNNNGFTDGTLEHSKAFTKIVEVVEDGNNNQHN